MTKTLSINGMSCQHCVGAVTEALSELDGVSKVTVNLEAKNAFIEFDESKVTLLDFSKAVEGAGFTTG